MKNPIATILMENGNEIVIELYPKCAPNTVNSFIYLANNNLFNNREIKRVVKDFVIQPSYSNFDDEKCTYVLDGEFRENGFDNSVKLEKWSVAMGGDGKKIASGSCFFISIGNNEEKLDGKYAGFGKVIDGFDEVMRIANVETKEIDFEDENVKINEPIISEIIKSITVETFSKEYSLPIILEQK